MNKRRKDEKTVIISVVLETEKFGDVSPTETIRFNVPKSTKYKPFWLYVYECEKDGEEILVKQGSVNVKNI